MTVRLSRQMREMLQTISSMCEAGVCDEEQLVSFTKAHRKALRGMRQLPKLTVNTDSFLSALDDYYKDREPNDSL